MSGLRSPALRILRINAADLGITATQRSVLIEYASFADTDGSRIFPSQQTLADRLGRDISSVRRSTEALIERGFLVDDGRQSTGASGWTRRFRIDIQAIEDSGMVPQPSSGEGEDSCMVPEDSGMVPRGFVHGATRPVHNQHTINPEEVLSRSASAIDAVSPLDGLTVEGLRNAFPELWQYGEDAATKTEATGQEIRNRDAYILQTITNTEHENPALFAELTGTPLADVVQMAGAR